MESGFNTVYLTGVGVYFHNILFQELRWVTIMNDALRNLGKDVLREKLNSIMSFFHPYQDIIIIWILFSSKLALFLTQNKTYLSVMFLL